MVPTSGHTCAGLGYRTLGQVAVQAISGCFEIIMHDRICQATSMPLAQIFLPELFRCLWTWHLWLGENWWQLGWCHHAQPRIRTFGQSRDNVFMRLAAVQPSACIGELSRLKKRVEIFETCWRIGCIWCIRVDSFNNLNLFHQGNPTLKCFFHRCSACVWVFGFSIEASGLPQDAFGPMGKQVREVMRCQMMPRGGGRAGN